MAKDHHRTAARHGQERRQAQAVLKALAGAAAQRSLCGAGQAGRLPLARGLQADRDRRQASISQVTAWPWSISAPRPAAGADRGRARRRGQRQGQGGRDRPAGDAGRSPASPSRSSISSTEDAPEKLIAMMGGRADVVMSDMARQHHRPPQDRPAPHHRPR